MASVYSLSSLLLYPQCNKAHMCTKPYIPQCIFTPGIAPEIRNAFMRGRGELFGYMIPDPNNYQLKMPTV